MSESLDTEGRYYFLTLEPLYISAERRSDNTHALKVLLYQEGRILLL